MLELIIALASVLGNLALAVLVYVKNPRRPVNKYFACFATTLALWAATNYISLHPIFWEQLVWIRIVMAVVAVMCLFILLLINVFPDGKPRFKRLPYYVPYATLLVALLALSPWLFGGIEYPGGQPQPIPAWGMGVFILYTVYTLGLSLSTLIYKFRRLTGIAREHVRYALIGIVVTFLLLFLTNFVVVIALKNSSLVAASPLISLLFTASFAYGMIRHRLFDIKFIITRFLAYLLFLVFAGLIYGFSVALLSLFVSGIQPSFMQILFSTLVVGVLILIAEPLRQFFNHLTRRFFYQDDYDTKDVLDKLTSVLVRSMDTGVLIKKSLSILGRALKPEYLDILILEDEKNRRRLLGGHMDKTALAQFSADMLENAPDVAVADSLPERYRGLHETMLATGTAVIVRLETQGGSIGYCFFGYKTSGSVYSQRDMDLMRIACDELAVAIQNTIRFAQIQEFNATLQQRVEEATRELRASNTQLQRLDVAKDEFVSMASHQLRTPLTSVKGYISMVLEGDAGKLTAMQRQLLGEAFTSSERMVHLINDFLNISRLQTGRFMLEKRAVNLAKVVEQEVDSLQTTVKAHDLEISYRAPARFPVLMIDEGKIRQVIMNFIDNAIYYSRPRTTIKVALSVEEGHIVLTVADTGIGVPKEEQAHLFTKFFRATNARKQRPDGTGVGLFLAKKVITAHGGSMVFESVEGEGSTFGFRLPIKKLSADTTSNGAEELVDKPDNK